MSRNVDNAFTRNRHVAADAVGAPAMPALHATTTAMPALETIAGEVQGVVLRLSPMRVCDALREWEAECASTGCSTLLIGPLSTPTAGADRCTGPVTLAADLARLVEGDGCEYLGDDLAVCQPAFLRSLLRGVRVPTLTLVRVAGEIERRDALCIRTAVLAGRPAWSADFRASTTLRVTDDESVVLETLLEQCALRLVAENVTHFLAALLDRDPDSIARPWPWQVKRLLDVSGSIRLRPEEADVYSTSVDLGVSTAVNGEGPAQQSLVYDRPSDTWHDEP